MSARLRVAATSRGRTRHIASPLTGKTLCGHEVNVQRTNRGALPAACCGTCTIALRQGWAS